MRIIKIAFVLIDPMIPERMLPPPLIARSRFASTTSPVARSVLPRSGWYPVSLPPRMTKNAVIELSGIGCARASPLSSKISCALPETAVAYGATPDVRAVRCRASPDLSNQKRTRGARPRVAVSELSTQSRSPLLLTLPSVGIVPPLIGRLSKALHCAATLVIKMSKARTMCRPVTLVPRATAA